MYIHFVVCTAASLQRRVETPELNVFVGAEEAAVHPRSEWLLM